MACYVVLFATLNYWQVAQEEELNANVENTRAVRREFNKPRGPIITADGIVAAESLPDPDPDAEFDRVRDYPTGDLLSNVTGYFTLNFGSTKVERVYGDVLTGDTTEQQIRALGDILSSDDRQLRARSSSRCATTCSRSPSSRSAGEPVRSSSSTSPPAPCARCTATRPTTRTRSSPSRSRTHRRRSSTCRTRPATRCSPGAYQQRFMPGSTFKVITTGIGLEAGVIDRTTEFVRESEWVPPQTTDPIQNYRGSTCGGDLPEVFRRSCNIPFAQTAINLGPDRMVAGVEALGNRRGAADRPARFGCEHVRRHEQPRPAASVARHPRVRPERRPDGAAAHGDGGRHRRQRRPDDGAVRGRGHVRPRRPDPRSGEPDGVEDADLGADRGARSPSS